MSGAENHLSRRLYSNNDPVAELGAASDGFKAWGRVNRRSAAGKEEGHASLAIKAGHDTDVRILLTQTPT